MFPVETIRGCPYTCTFCNSPDQMRLYKGLGHNFYKKKLVATNATHCNTIANLYGLNGKKLQRQFKDYLSDFKQWKEKSHAKDWLLFPENIGRHLSIDEVALSKGELYTIITIRKLKVKLEVL